MRVHVGEGAAGWCLCYLLRILLKEGLRPGNKALSPGLPIPLPAPCNPALPCLFNLPQATVFDRAEASSLDPTSGLVLAVAVPLWFWLGIHALLFGESHIFDRSVTHFTFLVIVLE